MLGLDKFFSDATKGAQERREPPADASQVQPVQRLRRSGGWLDPASFEDAGASAESQAPKPAAPSETPQLIHPPQKELPMIADTTQLTQAERELDQMLLQQAQIAERVQAKKQELKTAALAEIRAKISRYGMTADELGFTRAAAGNTRLPPGERSAGEKGKRAATPVKYRDPATGMTWTGRGRMPAWLQNKDRSVYLIDPAA
ncbi:MAG: H-NS histone family protein [Burkholderiaceae bacterium]|jgi:DNA-binding protein H-NS|nr:H-NS histone family protein [Burkholderiaceae bacterium]